MPDPGLFDEILARGPIRDAVSDRAYLAAMLDAEAALARAQRRWAIPDDAAVAIMAACDIDRYDVVALGAAARGPGNPVLPLVEALRAAVPPDVAEFVHYGATAQDILDTAVMLVAHRASGALVADLSAASDAAAGVAREHRDTAMAGRTLLQQAMPVTFGLKAAGWMTALDQAADRLVSIRRTRLAVQLGGPAGTLDGFGPRGLDLVERFAAELSLATPTLPWHTDRTRIAELAGALAAAAGVVAKIARDVTLLAQTEVAEVSEAAPGPSSAMAHKQNPVAAVSAYACASQAPGLAATLFASMAQEHERAAGGWQAEWRPLRELLVAVGSAAAWIHECLAGLEVHPTALKANLDRLATIAGLSDPVARLGLAGELVDRALAAHLSGNDRHGGNG